ncbi:MAG: hypothetical protein EXQ79_06985 [Acidimicrobiia bacterium]|nr:hypothetical protein [Acidimicrobiia bacterium]
MADQLGPAAAAALMECIPPFGWHEIATKADIAGLKVDIADLEEKLFLQFDARLHEEMNRSIKWTVLSLFGGLAAIGGAAAGIAAIVS